MIVSFDYDNTLTQHAELAALASALEAAGHRTVVLTGRKSDTGIGKALAQMGFPDTAEIITKAGHNGTIRAFKAEKLEELGADIHVDDDQDIDLPAWHPTKVLSFSKSRLRFGRMRM